MLVGQLTVCEAIRLYADHNEAQGKSDRTTAWYTQCLGVFATWLEQERRTETVTDLSVLVGEAFAAHLRRKTSKYETHRFAPTRHEGLSSHTVHGYVRGLRAFSTWLWEAGYLPENVMAGLKPPRTHKAVVDTLTDLEIQSLLGAVDPRTALGLRDYALIVTYLDTGARCSELLTLTMPDVHLDEGWLLLDGKGNKERMVRVGATAKAAIRLWLSRGRPAMAGDGCPYCFVDARSGGRLQVNAVEQRIRLIARSGLPGRRVYCHLFRHTFATNYLVYGLGDELHLMATLGHTTLLMVCHYVDKAKFLKALKERQGSVMDTLAGSRPRGRPRRSGMALWAARRAG